MENRQTNFTCGQFWWIQKNHGQEKLGFRKESPFSHALKRIKKSIKLHAGEWHDAKGSKLGIEGFN